MALLNETTDARRNRLIAEIRTVKEALPNSSFPFENERQATYFSRTRNNMKSDMAHATMNQSNQLDDLKILEVLRSGKLRGYNEGL